MRADGKQPKDNPRFVITNLKQSPQWIYEQVYCQRGEIENRIKELHDLQIDRTSCSDFWANQFRVLLTAAAYVLLQELRLRAARTNLRPRSGLDLARTAAETGRPSTGFRASRGRASAGFVSFTCPSSGEWRWGWAPRRDSRAAFSLRNIFSMLRKRQVGKHCTRKARGCPVQTHK